MVAVAFIFATSAVAAVGPIIAEHRFWRIQTVHHQDRDLIAIGSALCHGTLRNDLGHIHCQHLGRRQLAESARRCCHHCEAQDKNTLQFSHR
jgi:hypothetical protein